MVFYKTWCEHEVFFINDLYDYMGDVLYAVCIIVICVNAK